MKHKDSLSVNYIFQIIYQLLNVIIPLITTPYIARVLGPVNNGLYTYSFSISNYFVIFSALGIELYGNRLIARTKNLDKHTFNEEFSSLLYLHIINSVLFLVLYFIFISIFVKENKPLFAVQSLYIVASVLDINWLFFGLEQFRLTVTRNIAIKLLGVLCIFLFVKHEQDFVIYSFILAFSVVLSNLVLWFFVRKNVSFIKADYRKIFSHYKPLLILFFAVIATGIYQLFGKVMLGFGDNMVGLASFEYSDRMIRIILTLSSALGTVMLPRMSSLYSSRDTRSVSSNLMLSFHLLAFIAFSVSFGLAAISHDLLPVLLGKGYTQATEITKIMCLSVPIMVWNNFIRTQILIPKGNDNVYLLAVWCGAFANIICNCILISFLGAIGAAISLVLSYSVVGIVQTYPIRNDLPLKKYFLKSLIPFVSGIFLYISVQFFSSNFSCSPIIIILFDIAIGFLVFVLSYSVFLFRFDPAFCKIISLNLKKVYFSIKKKTF